MREESHELLDAKISLHDKHRFEVKLDVVLAPGRKNVYRVETYFFVPRALNLSPNTYNKNDFYASAQEYIRFRTPHMSLGTLGDAANRLSPLHGVHRKLLPLMAGQHDTKLIDLAVDEMKLLAAIARAAVRDFARHLLGELEQISKNGPAAARLEPVREKGLAFAAEVKSFTEAMNFLSGQASNPVLPARLRDAFRCCDEYLNLTLEDYLTILLHAVREHPETAEKLSALDGELVKLILVQREHGRARGYPSIMQDSGRNELMVYRRGVLKKFVSSALHLQVESSEWEDVTQFLHGLAAGAVLLFAAAVALYARNRYATDSMPFVAIVFIAYIFKDRIKDWLKLHFSKGMTRWLPDRRVGIKDPITGERIGFFKEAFSFVPPGQVPAEINLRRNADNFTTMDQEGKPERVMKYEKEVTLDPKTVLKFHERRKDLNDIMRFSIDHFLRQADNPAEDHPHLSDDGKQLEMLRCSRVYHVNMVIRYTSQGSSGNPEISYERVRIVFNRKGIVRLEEVPVA